MKKPLMKLTSLRVSSFITELNNANGLHGGSQNTNEGDCHSELKTVCCSISSQNGSTQDDPNGGCVMPVGGGQQLN